MLATCYAAHAAIERATLPQMSMSELAIDATGLVVCNGDIEAVKSIDLYVETGGVLTSLESNGAGMTTAIKVS